MVPSNTELSDTSSRDLDTIDTNDFFQKYSNNNEIRKILVHFRRTFYKSSKQAI